METDSTKKLELLSNAIDAAKLLIKRGRPTSEVLMHLASAGEALAGDKAVVSILILDEDGLLRNGASPKLPADYLQAIDYLKPRPDLGTCAAAAATGLMVVTPDFLADNKWAELRHLPTALGFVGAWSMPIKSEAGDVLGTFGTYYREKRSPTETEINGVRKLAKVAAMAISP
jgi:GAF domain-containing protein